MFVRTVFLLVLLCTVVEGVAENYATEEVCLRMAGAPPTEKRDPTLRQAEDRSVEDSLETMVTERNQRLYDSISSKTHRRRIPRLLYRIFFVRPRLDTLTHGNIINAEAQLAPYTGKQIGAVRIERMEVFSSEATWLERTANKLHTLTRESIIRRDLLFREGDRFDPELVARSQQLLQDRSYIADTQITVLPDPEDTTRVEIVVQSFDSWSMTIDAAWHTEKRVMLGLTEGNLLGTGSRLRVQTHLRRPDFTYGGNVVGYEIPNLFGSFYAFEVEGGRNFFEHTLRAQLGKEMLKPTDYELGISYHDQRERYRFLERDTFEMVTSRQFDMWGGWSRQIRSIRSSIYAEARYNRLRFGERPAVAPTLHPALHRQDNLLFSLGLYRERLFMTNMVYGFGTKEYVATGYKTELATGYTWGEYGNTVYLGFSHRTGGFCSFGYLTGGVTLGSHIDSRNGTWHRNAIDADLLWFSNLCTLQRSRLRQFIGLHFTRGWNRDEGFDERITFTEERGLQSFDERIVGDNRLVFNSETVLFTPIQPWGFRLAIFGFADAGTLGFDPNPFRNPGYTTLGVGVRIKNERLIFGALQIRLGIALGRGGLLDSQWISFTNSKHFTPFRYRPTRPEMLEFR